MTDSSILETTAEVSVAFSGFISVFLILASRDGRFAPRDAFAIRVIVVSGISPVFYAILPLLLHSLGVSEPTVWRASSVLMAFFSVLIFAVVMLPKWRAVNKEEQVPTMEFSNLSSRVLGAVHFFCLIANVFAWPWVPSGGVYLLAVWGIIAIAGTTFVSLIFKRVLDD